ncbi:hypothetical protein I070019H7_18840 [Bifidobacterium longum]|uniref:Phage tail protein n=1 Tax=Bifidobacterium longum subsp. longum TaxID=1679 RepID=A0A4R0VPH3_BIFLL|nr:phage tail domain-containing protein [Bifidobacterium longum]TCF68169.1 hypothetical protein MCC10119_1840 [Bifidobacterium longum subsp. longum]
MTRITIVTDTDTIPLRDDYRWKHHIHAIKKNGITGLFGTPGMKESTTSIPQQDGDYWPSRITQKPRSISLDCVIRGLSSAEAAQERDRINALFGKPLTIIEETAAGTRQLTGMLAADPEPTMRWKEQGFEFGLVITCPDPLKYGQPVTYTTSGGVIRCQNPGTAATWPSVRISGHVTSLTLAYAGHRVQWQGDAQNLALDFRDMIPSAGIVTYDDAFQIPPGGAVVSAVVVGGGAASMIVRPAWR